MSDNAIYTMKEQKLKQSWGIHISPNLEVLAKNDCLTLEHLLCYLKPLIHKYL